MQHADALIAILLGALGAAVLICLWRAKRGHIPYVRRIAGIDALEEAIGRATEMGRPVVFGMGWTDIRQIETHAALSILAYVARLTARMRTPLIVLVRVPNVYPVTEEIVRQAYTAEGVPHLFKAEDQIRFLSDRSVVYAMGTARVIEETEAGCALFFGAFDFTSLLMAEPGARMGVLQIAGDPGLFQIPFFVCTCSHTIIGEEYFAAGAYLSPDPSMRGTLVSQDIIKALFAGLIILVMAWQQVLYPLWWSPIEEAIDGTRRWTGALWLFALVPGSLWYFQLSKKWFWVSTLVSGLFIGVAAGLTFKGQMLLIRPQIAASLKPLNPFAGPEGFTSRSLFSCLSSLIFLVALLTTLLYFFFSVRTDNPLLRPPMRLGRVMIMICLGAMFSSTVMTRMAYLLERLQFLYEDWLASLFPG